MTRRALPLLLPVLALLASACDDAPDPYAPQKAALAFAGEQEAAARWAIFWDVATGVAVLVVVAGALAGLYWLWGRARADVVGATARAQLVYPDAAGYWPAPAWRLLETPQTAIRAHQRVLAVAHEAAHQSHAVPTTYHYHNQIAGPEYPALPEPEESADDLALPEIPRVVDLWQRGLLSGPEDLVGFTAAAQPLYLPSPPDMLIIGKKRTGKTTTARYSALRAVLKGSRLLIADPHMHANDDSLADSLADLAPFFVAPPAKDPAGVLALVEGANREMERRLAGGAYDHGLLILVDEIARMMSPMAEEWKPVQRPLAGLLELINIQGGKVRVGVNGMTQQPNASRMGGSELRTSFSTTLIHRLDSRQAITLPLSTEERVLVGRLPKGAGFLLDDEGGAQLIRVPYADREQVRYIASQVLSGQGAPRQLYPAAVPAQPPTPNPQPSTPAPWELDPARVETREAPETPEAPPAWSAIDALIAHLETPEAREGREGQRLDAATRRQVAYRLLGRGTLPGEIVELAWGLKGGRDYAPTMAELMRWNAQWMQEGWTA